MLNNFNGGEVATIRLPISLKFDVDDMYENFIVPARTSRTLTTLIHNLLRLYYENEHVRALLENDEDSIAVDDLLTQVDGIIAAEKENAAYMSILQTQMDGMNAYLEQQHSVLDGELASGINGMDDFMSTHAVETPLQIGVMENPFAEEKQSTSENKTSNDEMTDMMQTLMQQIAKLSDKVETMERNNTNTVGNTTTTQTVYTDVEDISVDEDAEDEETEEVLPVVEQKVKTAINMRTPKKVTNSSNNNTAVVPPAMAKLMGNMQKM